MWNEREPWEMDDDSTSERERRTDCTVRDASPGRHLRPRHDWTAPGLLRMGGRGGGHSSCCCKWWCMYSVLHYVHGCSLLLLVSAGLDLHQSASPLVLSCLVLRVAQLPSTCLILVLVLVLVCCQLYKLASRPPSCALTYTYLRADAKANYFQDTRFLPACPRLVSLVQASPC